MPKSIENIPWDAIEEKYAELFLGKNGMPAKPLRTALGSLLIQKQYQFSDRELVERIRENPYWGDDETWNTWRICIDDFN